MLEFLFAFSVTFAVARAEPGFVSARIGAIYDSNILVAPDGMFDQGVPSDLGDARLLTEGRLSYQFVNENRHRFGPDGLASVINTARAARAAGDPYLFEIAAPYVFDYVDANGYRLIVRPAFTSLFMDPTLTTTKTVTQSSRWITVGNRWRLNGWETGLDLTYRRDRSGLLSSIGPANADANRYVVHVNERFGSLGFDVGYILNQAAGTYVRYQRTEATLSYRGPLANAANFEVDLSFYRLKFPNAAIPRSDVNVAARARVNVPIDAWWTFELEATYAHDRGLTSTFDYDRFTVVSAVSLNKGF